MVKHIGSSDAVQHKILYVDNTASLNSTPSPKAITELPVSISLVYSYYRDCKWTFS